MDRLLTATEVRELLGGISEPTLHRLVRAGRLPVVKIAARSFFRPSDVDELVEQSVEVRSKDSPPVGATTGR